MSSKPKLWEERVDRMAGVVGRAAAGAMSASVACGCDSRSPRQDDEGFDLEDFHTRLAAGLDRAVDTLEDEVPRLLEIGHPVDRALGGGVGLGKLSLVAGPHEAVTDLLAYAALSLSEQYPVLYVPVWEREGEAVARLVHLEMREEVQDDAEGRQVEAILAMMRIKGRSLGIFAVDNLTIDLLVSWLLGDGMREGSVLENVVLVIDGLEMLGDNRPVNAILRDLRSLIGPTSAILAGCFAIGAGGDDASFAERHSNADALVRILHGDQVGKDDAKLIYERVFSWGPMG